MNALSSFLRLAIFVPLALATACSGDESAEEMAGDGGQGEVQTLRVTGSLVDFATGEPLSSGATLGTDGLSPAPTISVTGADFEIDGIPPFSGFHLLVGSPPDYHSTYSSIVQTEDSDLSGLEFRALSEDFIDSLYTAFNVTATKGTSLVIAKLVDEKGEVAANIPASAFAMEAGTAGPYFLDADRQPDRSLKQSSSSGYVVVFNVAPGLASFVAEASSDLSMAMADAPVAARAATLAQIVVQGGDIVIPEGVSFDKDIAPIFESRGCVSCHTGSGIGKDLGGLHLNGESQKMHKELVLEISETHGTARIDTENPEASLMLTLPSKEDPPDVHPNSTFTSSSDPDYLLMLVWIREGALNN